MVFDTDHFGSRRWAYMRFVDLAGSHDRSNVDAKGDLRVQYRAHAGRRPNCV